MQGGMVGNFEQSRMSNPGVAHKVKPFYAALYVPCATATKQDSAKAKALGLDLKPGGLIKFKKRAAIKRCGFGHHYYMVGGKKICPVHKYNGVWVISTK